MEETNLEKAFSFLDEITKNIIARKFMVKLSNHLLEHKTLDKTQFLELHKEIMEEIIEGK